MSRHQKNSADLSNGLKMAIGCEPSAMFCRSVKPDVPAYSSKYTFNLGFKAISSLIVIGDVNDISLLVI